MGELADGNMRFGLKLIILCMLWIVILFVHQVFIDMILIFISLIISMINAK